MRYVVYAGLRILLVAFVWAAALAVLIEFFRACTDAKIALQVP